MFECLNVRMYVLNFESVWTGQKRVQLCCVRLNIDFRNLPYRTYPVWLVKGTSVCVSVFLYVYMYILVIV